MNKQRGLLSVLAIAGLISVPSWGEDVNFEIQEFKVDRSIQLPSASHEAHEAWKDKRFGMFIHWDPVSQLGKQIGHGRTSLSHRTGGKPYKISTLEPEVYDAQYKTFNPVKFDPDEMMDMAKRAGVGYVVFTTKHHAGFSMFDSAVTDYDMASTPYKKDITKQLSDACSRKGMNFGIYYSPRDWYHPDCDSDHHHDRYIKFYKQQMSELLTKYGPIYEIWFDGMGPGAWGDTSREIMAAIRHLQPDAMVNDRGGAGADFYTPEHTISYFNRDHNWEACHTTTSQWGYNPACGPKKLEQLMEILLYTWGGDGNILLNIGPMGDGSVNPVERERFEQLADWWSVHGEESIRGSRGGPYLPGPWGVATCKDNRVFLHIFRWPANGGLQFQGLEGLQLKSARVLSGGKVTTTKANNGFVVDVPRSDRQKIVTTVELSFDGESLAVKPLPRKRLLMSQAKLAASHSQEQLKNLTDQNATTYWSAALKDGERDIWVEAVFEEPVMIASFSVARGDEWSPRHTVELQVPDGSKGWKTISPKNLKLNWETMKFLDEPVTSDRFRLAISNTKKFIFAEFELFPPVN